MKLAYNWNTLQFRWSFLKDVTGKCLQTDARLYITGSQTNCCKYHLDY